MDMNIQNAATEPDEPAVDDTVEDEPNDDAIEPMVIGAEVEPESADDDNELLDEPHNEEDIDQELDSEDDELDEDDEDYEDDEELDEDEDDEDDDEDYEDDEEFEDDEFEDDEDDDDEDDDEPNSGAELSDDAKLEKEISEAFNSFKNLFK